MADNTIHMMQLEKAMEQYEKLIFSICYRMLGDYFDAQDMTQETFLTYYRVLDRFDGQNEKAFLTKIATNKCLDILKSKRRKEMPAEDDINQELINACRDLKPPYNEVAYEFYCCDKTAREIAERRGIKLKTIQTQISRAKKMLQKKLKGGRYGTYN